MYRISKEFKFDAAHQLVGLASGHKCGNLHGHTYTVTVYLESETLNEHGFIQDYGELKPIKDFIDRTLDHKMLNEVFAMMGLEMNTSAENLAKWLYDLFKPDFPAMTGLAVSETEKTSALYYEAL